jgi:HEAT repeat protein
MTPGLVPPATWAQEAQSQREPTPAQAIVADYTVEQLFKDFLYYARLGQFRNADSAAKSLLIHPDLKPAELVKIADQDRKSIETIQILIKNSTIADSAARVMQVLERGRYELRKDPERLARYIDDLGGNPQEELYAIKGLIDGGEYSVPLLVAALQDQSRKELWPRIIQALPRLGKDAVGPMVQALSIQDSAVRHYLADALGSIGYPQAIPYLRQMAADAATTPEAKATAEQAVSRIEQLARRPFPGNIDQLFYVLGEQYYNEDETVRADTRIETANVWYWDAQTQSLTATAIPTGIFGPVMAMRCAEEAIIHRLEDTEAQALWLAANIRRESRLGFNVESDDLAEKGEADPTRPPGVRRALAYTTLLGPRTAHRVLARAVRDADAAVALGAIEALRRTAGEASLVGMEDEKQPLVQCLRFPDMVVRIRAALALGAALPQRRFPESELVVPMLAATLAQTGREQILVVDRDGDNANRVAGLLRDTGAEALVSTNYMEGIARARTDFQRLGGAVIATDLTEPDVAEALARFRGEFLYAKVPVVLLAKRSEELLARDFAQRDPYIESIDASADEAALTAAFQRVRERTRQSPLDTETALGMALQASDTLRQIAQNGRTAFDVRPAAPALINALVSADERLQTSAASVLALINAPAAQRAIAHTALSTGNSITLRVSAFGSLSESARTHGAMLEDGQVRELITQTRDDSDLVISTAAMQALGALNLAGQAPSEIIRNLHAG